MKVKTLITTVNIKLGGSIAQLNMPYATSCRSDAPCFKECYCNKGHMQYANVKKSHKDKYELYKANPKAFFDQISAELTMVPFTYFRWHASGDIVDEQYLDLMCKLARKHRSTHFLCYTKKYELVNEYLDHHRKPSNLVICLSNWGTWKVENPHNLPTSYVDFSRGDEGIPEFAYPCSGNCGKCEGTHCWHMKNGDSVVFHKH